MVVSGTCSPVCMWDSQHRGNGNAVVVFGRIFVVLLEGIVGAVVGRVGEDFDVVDFGFGSSTLLANY